MSSLLLELPEELIHTVTQFSDVASSMCLYLTCTSLYHLPCRPPISTRAFAHSCLVEGHLPLIHYALDELRIHPLLFKTALVDAALRNQREAVSLPVFQELLRSAGVASVEFFERAGFLDVYEDVADWVQELVPFEPDFGDDSPLLPQDAAFLGYLKAKNFAKAGPLFRPLLRMDVISSIASHGPLRLIQRLPEIHLSYGIASACANPDLRVYQWFREKFSSSFNPSVFAFSEPVGIRDALTANNLPLLELRAEEFKIALPKMSASTRDQIIAQIVDEQAWDSLQWLLGNGSFSWNPAATSLTDPNEELTVGILEALNRLNLPVQLHRFAHKPICSIPLLEKMLLETENRSHLVHPPTISPEGFVGLRRAPPSSKDKTPSSGAFTEMRSSDGNYLRNLFTLHYRKVGPAFATFLLNRCPPKSPAAAAQYLYAPLTPSALSKLCSLILAFPSSDRSALLYCLYQQTEESSDPPSLAFSFLANRLAALRQHGFLFPRHVLQNDLRAQLAEHMDLSFLD